MRWEEDTARHGAVSSGWGRNGRLGIQVSSTHPSSRWDHPRGNSADSPRSSNRRRGPSRGVHHPSHRNSLLFHCHHRRRCRCCAMLEAPWTVAVVEFPVPLRKYERTRLMRPISVCNPRVMWGLCEPWMYSVSGYQRLAFRYFLFYLRKGVELWL